MRALLLTLVISLPAWAFSEAEQKTLNSAYLALMELEALKVLSQACGNTDYLELTDEAEFKANIQLKLKMDLESFKAILKTDHPNFQHNWTQIQNLSCNTPHKEQLLEKQYDAADLALFALASAYELDKRLVSQATVKTQEEERREKAILEAYESAYSVAIGEVVLTESIPAKYKKQFIHPSATNKYAFHIIEGWKATSSKYVLMYRPLEGMDVEERLKPKEPEMGKFIFFIGPNNRIKAKDKLDASQDIIKLLGKTHWHWIGGDISKLAKEADG